MKFDHVAIGVGDHRESLRALTGKLGGRVISGGQPAGSGFRAMQIRIGRGNDGMTIEVLEPAETKHNDFLLRFLQSGGDRPHHVTFKTDDIEAELGQLRSLGVEPVGIDLRDPGWREMFIRPAQAHGTVIQIAQTNVSEPPMAEWLAGLPDTLWLFHGRPWWDVDAVLEGEPTSMERAVVETADRAAGDRFYSEVLGSVPTRSEGFTDHRWEGGTIRLVDAVVERPRVGWIEVDGIAGPVTIGGTSFRPVR
jgi:catechol 2,3-dioxygenase-like lactoylglutathione lyase family enzyme